MAKILTDKEMFEIINNAPKNIGDSDCYLSFLEIIAEVISNFFGGTPGKIEFNQETKEFMCAFHLNKNVPKNGGVFKNYDTDIFWKNGKETDTHVSSSNHPVRKQKNKRQSRSSH